MRQIVLVAALALSGCTALSVQMPPKADVAAVPTPITDKVVLTGTRGLLYAHNSYQGAVALLTPLIRADVFNVTQLDKINELRKQADALLSGANTTLTAAQRAQAVIGIAEQLYAMRR